MTPKQRWKANDRLLRQRINEGDDFRYVLKDLLRDPLQRNQFDLTRSELYRLKERWVKYETVSREEIFRTTGGF